MRAVLLATLLAACGGPSRSQLAETPTAQNPRPPSLAPPASGADKDRYQLNQSFEDMRDAQQAHREAEGGSKAAPPPPLPPDNQPDSGPPGETPPKKVPPKKAPPKK